MADPATKTYPQLGDRGGIAATDLLALYPTGGPLKRDPVSALGDYLGPTLPFLQSGTGAVSRTIQSKLRDAVSVKDFGAKCDGVTDDTAAVQAAVTYCLASTTPTPLLINGLCKAKGINIDRMVDTTTGIFYVFGAGPAAGFVMTDAGTFITSTFAAGADPLSERVQFIDLLFTSPTVQASYVISQKFLRVAFQGCYFNNIKLINSTIYMQDWVIQDCFMAKKAGQFITTVGYFGLFITGNDCETMGPFLISSGSGNHLVLQNNVYEGSDGPFVSDAFCKVMTISGNYFEGNTAANIVLNTAGGSSESINIASNTSLAAAANTSNPNFWDVVTGVCLPLTTGANYSNYQLFDNSLMPFGMQAGVDWAVTAVSKFPFGTIALGGGVSTIKAGIVAHSGGGQGSAVLLGAPVNFVDTCAADHDSVILPVIPASTPTANGADITVVNNTAHICDIYPPSGYQFSVSGTNAPYALAAAASLRCIYKGGGVWFALLY